DRAGVSVLDGIDFRIWRRPQCGDRSPALPRPRADRRNLSAVAGSQPTQKAADSSGSRSSAKSYRAHVATAPLASSNSKKGPLRLGAAPHLATPLEKLSPDVSGALLGLRLGRGHGLRRQLQHGCLLTLDQFGQEHGLAVRKLKRVVVHPRLVLVDLSKDRRLVGHPART